MRNPEVVVRSGDKSSKDKEEEEDGFKTTMKRLTQI